MHRRIAVPLALLALVTSVPACVDDSTAEVDERVLRIPADFQLCLVSPSPFTFADAPLFHYRGILRLDAGDVALPNGPHVDDDTWIAYTLQTAPDGDEVRGPEAVGAVSIAADSFPGTGPLEERPGWDTAVYTDDPAMLPRGDKLFLQVAYPADTTIFDLAPVTALDREGRLRVQTAIPGPAAGDTSLRVRAAPCERDDLDVDRVDVTLAEGTIAFHTRPAVGAQLGFTVLAEGEVDGIAIDVDRYWDLEYSAGDVVDAYGFMPQMAVRFAEQPDGACILVVAADTHAAEETWVARLLDCQQNELRDLTVESVDIVAGGGEARW